jgi:YggT family protein
MVLALVSIVNLLLNVLWWVIIIQVIISWLFAFNVLNMSSEGVRMFAGALEKITAPIYRPIRKILPDFGGIDFSPVVVQLGIMVLQRLLAGVALEYSSSL